MLFGELIVSSIPLLPYMSVILVSRCAVIAPRNRWLSERRVVPRNRTKTEPTQDGREGTPGRGLGQANE